jgi:gluconokinase
MVLVLMGVCGTGKTTLGQMLAEKLSWQFTDADDFHSEQNRLRMQAGTPLTDDDRQSWLMALNLHFREVAADRRDLIVACSALKQQYRQRLTVALPADLMTFAVLHAPENVLIERLRERNHAYMNPALLHSQLETLELPLEAWRVSVEGSPEESVNQILTHLLNERRLKNENSDAISAAR